MPDIVTEHVADNFDAVNLTTGDGLIYYRGVNVAGAEFNDSVFPGTHDVDYHHAAQATFNFLTTRGVKLVRYPIRMERLYRTLNGSLDSTELTRISDRLDWANAADEVMVLDIHNYGSYRVTPSITSSTNATPPVFTLTAAPTVPLAVGQTVQITGHSIGAYNVTGTIASVPSTTTFTIVGMTAA